MRSLKKILAGTVLTTATASIGVFSPVLEVKATPSLSDCQSDNFLVYFDIRNNVLAINETRDSVDCPVSNQISVWFHDHPHPIILTKVEDRWVSNLYPIYKGGCYAVEKVYVNPTHSLTPSWKYDQRIVIKSNPDSGYPISYCGEDNSHKTVLQPHPVAPTPPLEEELPRLPASPRQQESRSEHAQVSLDAESKQLLRDVVQLSRKLEHLMLLLMDWLKAKWLQLEPLIRAIESIKTS